jgi:hypothetical protein
MPKQWLLFCLLTSCLICACHSRKRVLVNRSFYYWKTRFELTDNEQKVLKDLRVKKLYMKFFDVDILENDYYPAGTLQVRSNIPEGVEVVPVVFITNRTLKKVNEYEIGTLASRVSSKIEAMRQCFNTPPVFHEIQIDCDWSEDTRDKYFDFLQRLDRESQHKLKVSATIRLHQVKYADRTGIPPVREGTLMFYNMGQLKNINGGSSIFNEADAAPYLVNFDTYPLKLNVALAVFSWMVVYQNGEVSNLVNDFDTEIKRDKNLHPVTTNVYEVRGPVKGYENLMKAGDMVKFEEMTAEESMRAAALVDPHLKEDSLGVILFDFNNANLKRYETTSLENIYRYFE